jgi:hypothetical protein
MHSTPDPDQPPPSGISSLSIMGIAMAIDVQRDHYIAALREMSRLPMAQRKEAVDRALAAAAGMMQVMQLAALVQERVYGPAGPPLEPDNPDAARKWAIETMATIVGRMLLPILGTDHYGARALLNDCARWLKGFIGEVFRPIGHANPATADPQQTNLRHLIVLLGKLLAAARGKTESEFVTKLPGAVTYDVYRSWVQPRFRASRDKLGQLGKRAREDAIRAGWRGDNSDPLPALPLLPFAELDGLTAEERTALQHYETDGEAFLAKACALVQGSGPYKGLSVRHGQGNRK